MSVMMAKLILNVANPETICGEAAQEVKFEQNSADAMMLVMLMADHERGRWRHANLGAQSQVTALSRTGQVDLYPRFQRSDMPSNIWLFDINSSSPTSSTTDLSHHAGAITVASSSPSGPTDVSHHGPADGTWPTLPASAKSQRTRNPIRAIVDPIVASAGKENREDGKKLISLAVRTYNCSAKFRSIS